MAFFHFILTSHIMLQRAKQLYNLGKAAQFDTPKTCCPILWIGRQQLTQLQNYSQVNYFAKEELADLSDKSPDTIEQLRSIEKRVAAELLPQQLYCSELEMEQKKILLDRFGLLAVAYNNDTAYIPVFILEEVLSSLYAVCDEACEFIYNYGLDDAKHQSSMLDGIVPPMQINRKDQTTCSALMVSQKLKEIIEFTENQDLLKNIPIANGIISLLILAHIGGGMCVDIANMFYAVDAELLRKLLQITIADQIKFMCVIDTYNKSNELLFVKGIEGNINYDMIQILINIANYATRSSQELYEKLHNINDYQTQFYIQTALVSLHKELKLSQKISYTADDLNENKYQEALYEFYKKLLWDNELNQEFFKLITEHQQYKSIATKVALINFYSKQNINVIQRLIITAIMENTLFLQHFQVYRHRYEQDVDSIAAFSEYPETRFVLDLLKQEGNYYLPGVDLIEEVSYLQAVINLENPENNPLYKQALLSLKEIYDTYPHPFDETIWTAKYNDLERKLDLLDKSIGLQQPLVSSRSIIKLSLKI